MRRLSPIRLLLAVLILDSAALSAQEPVSVQMPAWAATSGVLLRPGTGGGIVADWSDQTAPVKLLLQQPLALGAAHRLAVRARFLEGKGPIRCAFLLTDGQGRDFTYVAGDISTGTWQRLSAWPFGIQVRNGEIGTLSWPDITSVPAPPYTLRGIQLTGATSASVRIGSVETETVPRSELPGCWEVRPLYESKGGSYFEYTDTPQLYTDRLVEKPGKYRVVVTAAEAFNGPDVWQNAAEFRYDPESLPQGLPLELPAGVRWLTARLYDEEGHYLYRKWFVLDCRRGGREAKTEPPSILAIFPDADGKASWLVKTPPGTPSHATLAYRITDFYGKKVLDTGKAAASGTVRLSPGKPLPAGEAYHLECQLRDGAGATLDEASLLFSVPEASPAPRETAGKSGTAEEPGVLEFAVTGYWENYYYGGVPPPLGEMDDLIRMAKEKGFTEFRIGLDWGTLEPLPGAFRFREVDALVQAAKAAGLRVGFEVAGFYGGTIPYWLLSGDRLTNQEGEIDGLWKQNAAHFIPSPSDPRFLESLAEFYRAVARRYGSDPAVAGYAFSGLFSDHFYVDHRLPFGTVDYSASSLKAFHGALREFYGNSIPALNQRYGSSFASFDDVPLPWPVPLADPPQPDFRPQWADFVRHRDAVFTRYLATVCDAVREFDPRSWLQFYRLGGSRNELAVNILKDRGGQLLDGGDEQEDDLMALSQTAYLLGMRQTTESVVQMPANRYDIDMLFTRTYYGGLGAGYRILWNMGSAHAPAKQEACRDCIGYLAERWKPVLERLRPTHAPRLDLCVIDADPPPTAPYLRSYEASQRGGAAGLAGALLRDHLYPYWINEYLPLSALAPAKLAILNADMMALPSAYLDGIERWVADGGKLVTSLSAGRWALEQPQDDFYLLNRLGLKPAVHPDKRHHDPAVSLSAKDGLFRGPRQLALQSTGLDGKTGGETVGFEGTYQTEAAFADGEPAVVRFSHGKGEVLLFLQSPDWHKASGDSDGESVLDDLRAWAGGTRFFGSDQPTFHLSLVQDGEFRFLQVHRVMPYGTISHPTSFNEAQPRLSGAVQVPGLDPQRSYRIREITRTASTPFSATGDRLEKEGLPVNDMVVGETRVFEIAQSGK